MNLFWTIVLIILEIIYFSIFIYASMVIYSDMNDVLNWKRPVYAVIGGLCYTVIFIIISPLFVLIFPFWFITEISKAYKEGNLLEYIKNRLNIKERNLK